MSLDVLRLYFDFILNFPNMTIGDRAVISLYYARSFVCTRVSPSAPAHKHVQMDQARYDTELLLVRLQPRRLLCLEPKTTP